MSADETRLDAERRKRQRTMTAAELLGFRRLNDIRRLVAWWHANGVVIADKGPGLATVIADAMAAVRRRAHWRYRELDHANFCYRARILGLEPQDIPDDAIMAALLAHEDRAHKVKPGEEYRLLSPVAAGRLLGLSHVERIGAEAWTIAAVDITGAKASALAKARRNERRRARRRAAGVKPRDRYDGQSISRTKPWMIAGMSRAQWYRRGKPAISDKEPDLSHSEASQVSDVSKEAPDLSHSVISDETSVAHPLSLIGEEPDLSHRSEGRREAPEGESAVLSDPPQSVDNVLPGRAPDGRAAYNREDKGPMATLDRDDAPLKDLRKLLARLERERPARIARLMQAFPDLPPEERDEELEWHIRELDEYIERVRADVVQKELAHDATLRRIARLEREVAKRLIKLRADGHKLHPDDHLELTARISDYRGELAYVRTKLEAR